MIFYRMRNKSIVMKKKIDCNPQISKVNQWKTGNVDHITNG